MVMIICSRKPATLQDISDFEKKIQSILPNDYKDFLIKFNGGRPLPASFKFFSDRTDASSVDQFLSLGKEKNSNLEKYYYNYKNRIPSGFIPIAHDAGGNLVIMKLKNEDNQIYFWDHELEADEGENPNMENVYLICKSFSDFINNLYEEEI